MSFVIAAFLLAALDMATSPEEALVNLCRRFSYQDNPFIMTSKLRRHVNEDDAALGFWQEQRQSDLSAQLSSLHLRLMPRRLTHLCMRDLSWGSSIKHLCGFERPGETSGVK